MVKEMATHSSTLAWRIPWREEPGRLQSMASQSRTRLSDFTYLLTVVKNLPANVGDTGSISGSGSFLEKEMIHHSRILAWKIP